MQIKANIWIETDEGLIIGKGRAFLLEKIAETGSIAEAARSMDISYRKAWAMVKDMNNNVSVPLVEKISGGKNGGGTVLTEEGKKMIVRYKEVNRNFDMFRKQFLKRV